MFLITHRICLYPEEASLVDMIIILFLNIAFLSIKELYIKY